MVTIEQQLSRIDLNLLVSLSVLLKERNVTKAAQRLYLSQPAMSRALAKLREIFDDPLLYRESNGLSPTQKALELQGAIDELLLSTQSILSKKEFSPQSCDNTFTISIPPLMSTFLSVPLATALVEQAPLASMAEYPITTTPIQHLSSRDVDFSIHIIQPKDETEYSYQKLGRLHPVFYVSQNHPLAQKNDVTLEEILAYRFVDMSLDISSLIEFQNPIDVYLEGLGLRRDLAYKSGQVASLIKFMQSTDSVMASTQMLAKTANAEQLVPILSLQGVDEVEVNLYLIEHKRTLHSEPHKWFKELIVSTIRDGVFL
ncbi:LysR family transcriptional regulator [Vibrio ulleungensis]|uniref:LysR family transcriptional regulator n=1 Tax=Vibrio ulleungensis TaxID=2807619 RepID=A0ABS2HGF3_9VIBR|nr:LysR family transcriptional regulator [Vibrio ulleungensis]MBM7035177.1 LysR family transcriptional regulator [Vibrio ulleungensis]